MEFLRDAWVAALELYLDTAPFLLAGCLIGGLVYAFFPGRIIERWLGGRGFGTIVGAALVGTPLPLCSCGVVPTAVTLRRRGASTGATVSFLVATPETGPDSVLVSFALLDPLFAIFRPLAAIATAIVSGLFASFGEKSRPPPLAAGHRHCEICALPDEGEHHHGARARTKRAFGYAFRDLLEDIGPWLFAGVALAGVLAAWLGTGWVDANLPSRHVQMLVAMTIGILLYVCASASTPLAAAAIAAGFSPGAALVLMLTGPATNIASLLMLRRELGGKVVALMLAGIAAGSLASGYLLDFLYEWSGATNVVKLGPAGEMVPGPVRVASAVLLTLLIVVAVGRKLGGRGRAADCATCHEHEDEHEHEHEHGDAGHERHEAPHAVGRR